VRIIYFMLQMGASLIACENTVGEFLKAQSDAIITLFIALLTGQRQQFSCLIFQCLPYGIWTKAINSILFTNSCPAKTQFFSTQMSFEDIDKCSKLKFKLLRGTNYLK
jgi:hypothetical protein